MASMRAGRFQLVFLGFFLISCKSAPPPAAPPTGDLLARQAAEAFLVCYEREGAECRPSQSSANAWASMRILSVLRDRIPTEIVDELPRGVEELKDEARLRRTFIKELEGEERWARTAGCRAGTVRPIGDAISDTAQRALARLEQMGLESSEMGQSVATFAQSVGALREARLVQTACSARDHVLALVFAPADDGVWRLVALMTEIPAWLQGPKAPTSLTRITLPVSGENLADPWIPVYEEQL